MTAVLQRFSNTTGWERTGLEALAFLLAFLLLRYLVIKLLTSRDFDLQDLRKPSLAWVFILAPLLALQRSQEGFPGKSALVTVVAIVLTISITMRSARAVGRVSPQLLSRVDADAAVTGLARLLLQGGVIMVGILVLLQTLGVAITPLLTALGVGGLAVALALQDTLSNLFAGVHILMEKPFSPKDFIRLSSGLEGWVQDINWRTTRIRTRTQNLVVIPNREIAGTTILNISLPKPQLRVETTVGVDYDCDPVRVQRILEDVAAVVMANTEGALTLPAAEIHFANFGSSSLDFTIRFYISEYHLQEPILGALHTAIYLRFSEEGITIPFPITTLRGLEALSPS
ncbi:MAG: mechanosensitive ion channel protein [Myxococcales bacterium]|nr:mechanosensitive ion channel protein [Myxococcales bacterium]